jgi:hypothetical protein
MGAAEEVASMKRVRIRSLADLEALPDGEWLHAIDGLRWNVPYEATVDASSAKVSISVPKEAVERLPFREGEPLKATLRHGVITVRRAGKRKARKTAQR